MDRVTVEAAGFRTEGARICLELLQQFSQFDGIAGAHVMAPERDEIVPNVITKARRSGL